MTATTRLRAVERGTYMVMGKILIPVAEPAEDIADPGPEAGPLAGKTVGFRVDPFWRSWDWITDAWTTELEAMGATVLAWRAGERLGTEGERTARELDEFVASVDLAVVGLAN